MDTIFRDALKVLIKDGEIVPAAADATSPHSRFGLGGPPLIEVRHWTYHCHDLRNRLLLNPMRAAWLEQAIGLALWQFGARGRLDEIEFYNPNARKFSDDGYRLRASWGERLFAGRASLYQRCIDLLKRDPSSMRAIACTSWPEDTGVQSKDVPCLISMHFLIRNGALDLTCHLRALNPYWVFPYDHFFLTILLEFSAGVLGLSAGTLTYMVNSLHLSLADRELAISALSYEGDTALCEMPAMASGLDAGYWNHVSEVEAGVRDLLRKNQTAMMPAEVWEDIVAMAPDRWSRELFQALIHAHISRNSSNTPLGLDCPAWAATYLGDMRFQTSGPN